MPKYTPYPGETTTDFAERQRKIVASRTKNTKSKRLNPFSKLVSKVMVKGKK